MGKLLRMGLGMGALAALGACQSLPALVPQQDGMFAFRYEAAQTPIPELDQRADAHCGGKATFISQETRYDGFQYRTYRCEVAGS